MNRSHTKNRIAKTRAKMSVVITLTYQTKRNMLNMIVLVEETKQITLTLLILKRKKWTSNQRNNDLFTCIYLKHLLQNLKEIEMKNLKFNPRISLVQKRLKKVTIHLTTYQSNQTMKTLK